MDFRVIKMPLDQGPTQIVPRKLIVHCMAEYVDYGNGKVLHAVDCLRDLGLSAHFFITPSGIIIQSRECDQGAWHAIGHNYDGIGAEFLVPGVYTIGQMYDRILSPYLFEPEKKHGFKLCRHLVRKYNLDMHRHSDVDPERKKDPGEGFPWVELQSYVGA